MITEARITPADAIQGIHRVMTDIAKHEPEGATFVTRIARHNAFFARTQLERVGDRRFHAMAYDPEMEGTTDYAIKQADDWKKVMNAMAESEDEQSPIKTLTLSRNIAFSIQAGISRLRGVVVDQTDIDRITTL